MEAGALMDFDPDTARPLTAPAPQAAPAAAPQQQQAPQQAQQPQGNQPPSMMDEAGSMLWTALHSATDAATFGLADKASAGLATLISPMTGKQMSYDEAYQKIQANNQRNAAANPVSAAAGNIAGTVLGAGKLAKVASAIPGVAGVVDALAPVAKSPVTNVLKSAVTGGAAAGGYTAVDNLARTGSVNPDDVLINTATGAALGPAVTKIGTALAKGVVSSSTKAMQLLADKLGETPDVLQNAYNNFAAATGRVPTMAELVGMKSQGELKQLASNNPIVQQGVNEAADTAASQRPQTLAQTVEDNSGGPAQDINQLTQARKARMTQAMDPIRTQPVTIDDTQAGLLQDPRVRSAIRRDPDLRGKVDDTLDEIDQNGSSTNLTINDMDNIRQSLRGQQTALLNPANSAHNPHVAAGYGNMADNIADLATGSDPTHPYAQALSQFEQDSNYIKGFKHGAQGKTIGEAGTPDLINALNEPEGQAGHQAGIVSRVSAQAAASPDSAVRTAAQLANSGGDTAALRQAVGQTNFAKTQAAATAETKGNDALNAITGRVNPDEESFSGRQAAQTVAAAASHSPAGLMFHAARAIPSFTKQSPAVQQQIVKYLANPNMTQQGINLLRKAGARDEEIRKFAVSLSAATGANVASTMGQ